MKKWFILSFLVLSACSTQIPGAYKDEKAVKKVVSTEELLENVAKKHTFDYEGEKVVVEIVPYTWPVMIDRMYAHYKLEKEPGKKRLKELFKLYRKKYKKQTCFYIHMNSQATEIINPYWWNAKLVNGKEVELKFQKFLAHQPTSYAKVYDEKVDRPFFGDDPKVLNLDLCASEKINFAGEMNVILSPKGESYLSDVTMQWIF